MTDIEGPELCLAIDPPGQRRCALVKDHGEPHGWETTSAEDLIAAARLIGPDNVAMLPRLDLIINDLADALEVAEADRAKLTEERERTRRVITRSVAPVLQEAYDLLSDHLHAHGPASDHEADAYDPELQTAQRWREARDRWLEDQGDTHGPLATIDAANEAAATTAALDPEENHG